MNAVRRGSKRSPKPYRRITFWVGMCIPALLVLYCALLYFTLPRSNGEEAALKRFFERANSSRQEERIESAVLLNEDNRILFTSGGRQFWVALPSSEQFTNTLVQLATERDIPLDIDQQPVKSLIQPATYIVPALIIVAAFILFFLMMRSGASPFLKFAARRGASDRPVSFSDVAGLDDAVEEVREVRDYLMTPERFHEIGAEPPRGILLVGPPGTGKTLLARAVAGEAGVPFFAISGTDFVEMYVGVGAARVRDLFRQVRERAPAILFIDELDAVGRTRVAEAAAGQDERDQTLNQLLVELDGFHGDAAVVLIGATNRPDILDPALLRRGRFDRHIVVGRPDRAGRSAILEIHALGKNVDPSLDLSRLAAQTPGFTGADLASVMNEAALLTARRGRRSITEVEVEEALDRIMTGKEGRARLLSAAEKSAVAGHEAGHAILTWALQGGPVAKVSIMGGGRAVGFTRVASQSEKVVVLQSELEDELATVMGGRAAEELVLGQATSSSKDDLRRATALARRMVCELGMSESLGRRALGHPSAGTFLDDDRLDPDYSYEVAAEVDREIARLVDNGFARALHLLTEHRDSLDSLARLLAERESLREAELAPFAAAVGGAGLAPPDATLAPPVGQK